VNPVDTRRWCLRGLQSWQRSHHP